MQINIIGKYIDNNVNNDVNNNEYISNKKVNTDGIHKY